MKNIKEAFKGNRESWNKRAEIHFDSEFYDNKSFLKGKTSLKEIELSELGDINGKKLLHLQCHFGQDTLSFSRMGAEVTGIDLSDKGIDFANKLKEQAGLDANFIVSNIYDLKDNLDEKFDVVYTSYGVLGWLPDLDKWANIVSHFLKPNGVFYIAEFHPIVWTFDEKFENIAYPYQKSDVIIEDMNNTYGDKNVEVELRDYMWNHGLGDVINSLINSGLEVEFVNEHNFSPYNVFDGGIEVAKDRFMIKGIENMIPLVYSIKATRKS
ncbi:MAG: class I SAM-dependent methyltransferase [Bacteroidota bacterium]